jgi:tetratricopeptide (TPR) repeat protein
MPKFCPNCGTEVSDNVKFCPNCGTNIDSFSVKKNEDSILKENKESAKFWYNEGVDFTESKEYDKALMAYDRALTFDSKDPDIWNNKCFVLTKLGRCDEAVLAGNKAVQISPQDPQAWDNLCDAYTECKNKVKADECRRNASKLQKQSESSIPSSAGRSLKGSNKSYFLMAIIIITAVILLAYFALNLNQPHLITLHFSDYSGNPIVGAHVYTGRNNGLTDSEGNFLFLLEKDFDYRIKIVFQDSITEFSPINGDSFGNYKSFIVDPLPFVHCNIEYYNFKENDGQWTIYGYVNNTGRSGFCNLTAKTFNGNWFTVDHDSTPVDSRSKLLSIEHGKNISFSIDVNAPTAIERFYEVSVV